MTRLVTCGWETNDINEVGILGGTGFQSLVSATPTPRSPGTYCFKVGGTSNTVASFRTVSFGGAKTDIWIRCGVLFHTSSTSEINFLRVQDSLGANQGALTWSGTDRFLRAYRGPVTTQIAVSAQAMPQDEWHTVDLRWQVTSTTVGIVEVWVDDTNWITFSGDNTQTTTANVGFVDVGVGNNVQSATNWTAIDDLAINDTSGTINNGRIGDGRVVLLKPNGAGSTTGQTRGGTDTGANWSQTSEIPPSMTQYVYSATGTTRDTYALENVPVGSWTVNCCEVLVLAQNSDAGAGSLGLTVKSGSTTNEGTPQALTTSTAYYRQLYERDPDTSAAWTVAAVSAMEAGTTVR